MGGIVMARTNFNSCMREDYNMSYRSILGIMTVLIHACAKIATWCGWEEGEGITVLIHTCAKIATGGEENSPVPFLIHACAKIATQKVQEWEEWAAF